MPLRDIHVQCKCQIRFDISSLMVGPNCPTHSCLCGSVFIPRPKFNCPAHPHNQLNDFKLSFQERIKLSSYIKAQAAQLEGLLTRRPFSQLTGFTTFFLLHCRFSDPRSLGIHRYLSLADMTWH